MKISDNEFRLLIQGMMGGDERAWKWFADNTFDFLYRYACNRGLQDADASDFVQNTLVRVIQALVRLPPDYFTDVKHFMAWLLCILQRLVLDRWRWRGRRPDESEYDDALYEGRCPEFESDLEWRDLLVELLSPEEAKVILLRFENNCSQPETAGEAGMSVDQVRSRETQAKAKLKRYYRREEDI